jgi:hypothetical protein
MVKVKELRGMIDDEQDIYQHGFIDGVKRTSAMIVVFHSLREQLVQLSEVMRSAEDRDPSDDEDFRLVEGMIIEIDSALASVHSPAPGLG